MSNASTLRSILGAATPEGGRFAALAEVDSTDLIARAKARDTDALFALMRRYAPAIRSALSVYRDALDAEDAEAEVMAAFLTLVDSHDPERSEGLGGRVQPHLSKALAVAASGGEAWAIPSRTLQRYYGILRRADGDHDAAAEMAPDYEMATETFRAVQRALSTSSTDDAMPEERPTVDAARPVDGDPAHAYADVEDRLLVSAAFNACDLTEAAIARRAYGFTYTRPMSDAEIAADLPMPRLDSKGEAHEWTRPTVQRRRADALGAMREALGVDA